MLEIQNNTDTFMVRVKDDKDEEELLDLLTTAFAIWDSSEHKSRLHRVNDEVNYLFQFGAHYSLTTDSIRGFQHSAVVGYFFSESLASMQQACPAHLNVLLTEVVLHDEKSNKAILFKAGDLFGASEDGKTLLPSMGVSVAVLFMVPVLQGKADVRQATVAAWRCKVSINKPP